MPLNGVATPEQIAEWKKKCPKGIYQIVVNGHVAYFRNPQRQDVSVALSVASDEYPLAAIEKFGELTQIGGSEEVLKDDSMFLASSTLLKQKLMASDVQAVLGNL